VRVAHLTSVDPDIVDHDLDRPFLERAFARRGIELIAAAWDDDSVDWDGFDLIVVRSPWNYVEHEEAFRGFLERFDGSVRFWNPVGVIRWNLDKRYLAELADAGVPVIPTTYVARVEDLDGALASVAAPEVVVKPTVSAGSRLTGRFAIDDERARMLAVRILDDGGEVMVQPYLSSVDTESEYAVVVIDGTIAHRARKAQILDVGGTFTGGEYRELLTAAAPVADLDQVALLAASACGDLARQRGWSAAGEELLYARYDVARTDEGGAVLLEAELFEPALFLPVAPDSAALLAAAVERRLSNVR
jgi:hypothetical protein